MPSLRGSGNIHLDGMGYNHALKSKGCSIFSAGPIRRRGYLLRDRWQHGIQDRGRAPYAAMTQAVKLQKARATNAWVCEQA